MSTIINEKFSAPRKGGLTLDPNLQKELEQVKRYYEFYDGFDDSEEKHSTAYGQMWETPDNMDYDPTKEVRNLTKKLINKQGRFMMGKSPNLIMRSVAETGKSELSEDKQAAVQAILDQTNFWSKTSKAFIDCTIGKRVLMMVVANEGKPFAIKYYTMPEFTYKVDSYDETTLTEVEIVYQDEETLSETEKPKQVWHRWKYTLDTNNPNATCICTKYQTDGNGEMLKALNEQEQEVELKEEFDTGLSKIPCYVILNEGLTGDTQGTSDIKDLMLTAHNYNKTISDFRDALRFKMFDVNVVIDGDSRSISELRIAPNSLVDLKSDPKQSLLKNGTSSQARIETLGSSFNFNEVAKYYLDNAKKDMYELMDIPLPEKVQEAPSGIAMTYLFYDLMSRCENKWMQWDDAISWLMDMIEEVAEKVSGVQFWRKQESYDIADLKTETTLTIEHNYPIPESEEDTKRLALDEIKANVRSRRAYMKDHGNAEAVEVEWANILEEEAKLEELTMAVGIPDSDLDNTDTGEGDNLDGEKNGKEKDKENQE